MAEVFSRKRAKVSQQLDWNRLLFEKYADAYREFLASWGGAFNVELLERNFEVLQSKAVVPSSLTREYEQSVSSMRGIGTKDQRRAPAHRLRQRIEAMLRDPLGFVNES
ncbi:MAG TPA: hypothetical protein VH275_01230 [Solirubrobacterales bacterium]|jgi:hypothetical protein|nr:hypothetical protein [Solirubrobacterales bacterium]